MELTLNSFLAQMMEAEASDLHLRVGLPPMMRVHGDLHPLPERPALNADLMKKVIQPTMTDETLARFRKNKALNTSYALSGVGRFRVALFLQQGHIGGVLRQIPEVIPTLEQLKSPAILKKFAASPRGLVIVTGPTGSGKSTTLAATVNAINNNRRKHILTIEDPVEFVHTPQYCLINQREIPKDAPTFNDALEDALRQDPDVILLGELRGLDTMRTALTAAETGHLVFATLHTSSAPSSIDRLVDAFPEGEQNQIRTMVAGSLVGIVAQTLLPTVDGDGRVAAHEILVADSAVRNQIRRGQTESIRNEIVTKSNIGMQTMDLALAHLVKIGKVSEEIARGQAQLLSEFEGHMDTIRSGGPFREPDLLGDGNPGPLSTQ